METTQPGTVAYMPPEALTHDSTYNATIDVFSLGVVFVCIATQREPTVGMSEIGSRPELKRRARDLQPLSRGHPLEFFINRCLQDNCENRPDVFMIHHVLNPLIQGIHLPDIQSRLEMTEKRKESLEEKVKKTEQKLDMEQKAFQEKVKKTEEQLYKEQTAFKAERDKLSVLEKKYTTLQAERDKLMLKTMNMEKKCDSLQDSLKQTCEENRAFQLKTRRVNEFLQDEREKLRNMEEMCVSLKNQLKVKTVREEDLMKELATTKGKLTETQDQLKTHQQKQKVTMQNLQELLEEQAQIQQEQVKVWQSQIQEQANVEKNFHSRMMKCLQDDRKSSN
jgi:serine/threonine protein kinase